MEIINNDYYWCAISWINWILFAGGRTIKIIFLLFVSGKKEQFKTKRINMPVKRPFNTITFALPPIISSKIKYRRSR